MRLSKENIVQWLTEFDHIITEKGEYNGNYSETEPHERWLENYSGVTPEDAAAEEISNWQD